MKRTCLTSVLVLVVCLLIMFGVSYGLLSGELAQSGKLDGAPWWALFFPALGMTVPSGVLGAWGLAYLYTSVKTVGEKRSLNRQSMSSRWMDGEAAAVSGTVTPLGPVFRAPVSGSPSVGYSYDIFHLDHRSKGVSRVSDYSGFSFTPFAIQTMTGPVTVIGYLNFDFPETTCEEPEHYRNAESYITETQFKGAPGLASLTEMFADMQDALTDADGVIRKDWTIVNRDFNIHKDHIVEQNLAPGDPVCAFGRYVLDRNALVTDAGGNRQTPVRIIKGELASIQARLTRRVVGYFLGGCVVLAVGVAVFCLVYRNALQF